MANKVVQKATKETLEVGKLYMGYSAQSKKLSSNGHCGVICQFEGFTADGRATVNTSYKGAVHKVNIARVDERPDVFLIPLQELMDSGQVHFELTGLHGDEPPRTSQRMYNLIEQGQSGLTPLHSITLQEAAEIGSAIRFHALYGETEDGQHCNVNTLQVRQTKDLLALLRSEEEKRKRELGERRAQIAALKEGGVRLVRGKPENGELLSRLKPLREQLAREAGERQGATAFFGAVTQQGDGNVGLSDSFSSGACHARIKEFEGQDYILTSVQKGIRNGNWPVQGRMVKKGMKSVFLTYIDYLANRSPYSCAVETKDAQDIWDYGWVISTEHPSNLISSLCTATRHVWEYPARCYAFAKMVEKGVSEDLAFVACLSASGDPSKGELDFQGGCVEHTALMFNKMTDLDIVSFCLGNMPNANPNLKDDGNYYSPNKVWSLFCPSSDGQFPEGENTLIKALQGMPKMSVSESSNPFVTAKTGADKAIDYAVKTINKWVEDLGV